MATGQFIRILVFISTFTGALALWCYSCSATGRDNRCEQYSTYKEADYNHDNVSGIFKQCRASYNDLCFIETYSSQGITHSHIRDCNEDNGTFSFNGSLFPRLDALGNNNETVCVWQGTYQICLSKCTEDFCNGPLIDEIQALKNVTSSAVPIGRWTLALPLSCIFAVSLPIR